jgi:phosphoglucosamine mutase
LKNTGRILVRPSGTEPLIRIMIEGNNEEQITQLANELLATVEGLNA